MKIVQFMSTPAGRAIRVVMGIALIAFGVSMSSGAGWALAAFGLLPLATGAVAICPICPILSDTKRSAAGCQGSTCS